MIPSPRMTRPAPPKRALRPLWGALVCACLLSSLAAHAAQPTTADVEKLIKRGNELRTSGKDHQALPLYQKAYEGAPTPRTAAQLGLCEMALNYWLAADGHLSEALAGKGEWIDKNRGAIEASLRQVQKQIGEVIVSGSPVGAAVSVGGKQVGTLPLAPLRVAAGQLKIEVSAPGYRDRSETVVVVGESQERVTMNLAHEGAPVEPMRTSGDGQPSAPAGGVGGAPASGAESPAWSTGKIAGAAVIIGGGLMVLGGASLLLIDKQQTCDAPAGGMCKERNQMRGPGWGLIGVGAAAVVVGALVVHSSSSGEVAIGVSPTSLVLAGRF